MRNSIYNVIKACSGSEETAKQMMENLRKQVQRSIMSINLYRSPHDDDKEFIHCYCLAIAFYLDHYAHEDEKKLVMTFKNKE